MKSFKRYLAIAIAVVAIAIPASAKVMFGPRVGLNVNSLHFSTETFDAANRAGFTGGLELEFTAPVIGVGFDASVMYVRRSSNFMEQLQQDKDVNVARNYISIPVNLKWKIKVPVIEKAVTPYLFTGPDFAFLTSKAAITDAYKNKKFDVSWNFGFGVQLVGHLQVGASYGLGLTKAIETVSGYQGQDIGGKNRYWTVTAAYLF